MSFNIAIDGPAGAGKSTIAKRLAKELSFVYVDTGAMYRAMALYAIRKGIDPSDEPAISGACEDIDITIQYEDGTQCVFLNGENVNACIRTEEAGRMASGISIYPAVRAKLTALQQKLGLWQHAGVHVRAKRRYEELKQKGEEAVLAQIEADIRERDERDMTREISPLRQAGDAVLVDTSDMGIAQAVAAIRNLYDKAVAEGKE